MAVGIHKAEERLLSDQKRRRSPQSGIGSLLCLIMKVRKLHSQKLRLHRVFPDFQLDGQGNHRLDGLNPRKLCRFFQESLIVNDSI